MTINPQTPRCLVVLPTYNERGNVETLVSRLLALPGAIDVLVVDDGSPDGTAAVVRELAGTEPRVALIERAGKMGLGSAYLAGFGYAFERGYEAVCTMDADCSHDPAHLPAMLELLADNDLVIGSRYCPGGKVERFSAARKVNSFVANTLAHAMTGLRVSDMTSGYRVYRTELLRRMPLDALEARGYSMLVELLYVAQSSDARIAESPIVFRSRHSGESKISAREIIESLRTLAQIRRKGRISARKSATA